MQTIEQTMSVLNRIDSNAYGVQVFAHGKVDPVELERSYRKMKEAIEEFQAHVHEHDTNILTLIST